MAPSHSVCKIVALDLGTYCDQTLMATALDQVRKAFLMISRTSEIVHITDSRNAQAREDKDRVVRYKTPSFLLGLDGVSLADPNKSASLWALKNPIRAYKAREFMKELSELLAREMMQTDSCVALVAYPATPAVLALHGDVLDNVLILDYAPAFPNSTVPWLFDSRMTHADFRLYRTSAQYNAESHNRYYALSQAGAMTKIQKITHLACWDHSATREIEPLHGIRVVKCRSLVPPPSSGSNAILANNLLKRKQKIVLVTFGSYANEPLLLKAAKILLSVLLRWSESNDALIVHVSKEPFADDGLHYHRHDPKIFLDYATLVMHCVLVVFTGSICLQNASLSCCTAMLFVPFLPEQYFWAKNYQDMTRVAFVDPLDLINSVPMHENITRDIIQRGQKSMAARDKMKRFNSIGDVVLARFH